MPHKTRLTVSDVDSDAVQAVLAMERYARAGTLDPALTALIRVRASQLNGCAFCLDMHSAEARAAGVEQRRLDILPAWREAPSFFTEREQAAFRLTESVTRIGEAGVPDAVWDAVAGLFDEHEIVRLLMAICAINVWNRIAISTHQALPARAEPGKKAPAA
ncbi:MAG: carboxymuconolactone decarboxylase family protein [Acidobacteria bacterium]|nr:carboxymuconolactone decarboxylase family protein [Acidobacteriota bacterium]